MNIGKNNVLEAIGNTPIVKLNKVTKGIESEIYVKIECLNPGGSIKDRIGTYILNTAMKKGLIQPGGTVIEATSGNTGIGLAMFSAVHNLKLICVMTDKQSQEKIDALKAFGAEIVICPTNVEPDDPRSYYCVAEKLSKTIPNSYYVNQYQNQFNRETHFNTTGPEIYEQTGGHFDTFIAGVGTGGTISGTGAFLKTKMKNLKVIGVDIEGSILAHYHKTGELIEVKPYVLEGLGEDILPENVVFSVIDDFVVVKDKESFLMTRDLLRKEGLYVGGSSGAAVVGALRYARSLKKPEKILVILPDSGNRYQSKIFNDDWMRRHGYIESPYQIKVSELLSRLKKKIKNLLTLDQSATIGDSIKFMETHNIGQVPIRKNNEIVGVISEKDILIPLYQGKLKVSDNIAEVRPSEFELVKESDPLEKVNNILEQKKVPLVMMNGEITNILTHIDILNFFSLEGKLN